LYKSDIVDPTSLISSRTHIFFLGVTSSSPIKFSATFIDNVEQNSPSHTIHTKVHVLYDHIHAQGYCSTYYSTRL
jgi:hypothetical protein